MQDLEHPLITYYNQHGYLPKEREMETEEEGWIIGRCSNCNEFVMSGDEELILYEDQYFCCVDCLEEHIKNTD